MQTTVTFAGNLAEDPELEFTRAGKTVANFRVLVNRSTQSAEDQWIDAETTTTRHNCRAYGASAANLIDSLSRGDRVMVHGNLKTEAWRDKETGEKRARQLVVVDERDGELGTSLRFVSTRVERPARPVSESA